MDMYEAQDKFGEGIRWSDINVKYIYHGYHIAWSQ